jgi:hypothetical protein
VLDQCDRPPSCPAERGVDQALAQIQFPARHQVLAQSPQDGVQHLGALSLLKTAMTGLIGAVTARKILPRCTRAQNPQHAVQHLPRLAATPAPATPSLPLLLIPFDNVLHAFSLKIAQVCHASGLLQLPPECKSLFIRYISETGLDPDKTIGLKLRLSSPFSLWTTQALEASDR